MSNFTIDIIASIDITIKGKTVGACIESAMEGHVWEREPAE